MPRIYQKEETVPIPISEGTREGTSYRGAVAKVQEHTPKHETQQEESKGNKYCDFISLLPSNVLPVRPRSQKPEDTRDGMIPSVDIISCSTKQRGM